MFQSLDRPVALTFSGGIDSTVLAYYFCQQDATFRYLSPTPRPPGQKTTVHLIQADIGKSANYTAVAALLDHHLIELHKRFGNYFHFIPHTLTIPLPLWAETGLQQVGYVPSRHGDNPNDKTFTELGPDVHIDGRNAMFLLWILSYCAKFKIDTLLTGHQLETYEWDELDCYRARTEDIGVGFVERMNLLTETGFKHRVRIVAPWLDMRLSKYHIVKIGRQLGINLEDHTYSCYFYPECGKCGNCIMRKKALAVIAK
jgi:7-cyano-7-deazaguanine synthase in queuosine biosynthesis